MNHTVVTSYTEDDRLVEMGVHLYKTTSVQARVKCNEASCDGNVDETEEYVNNDEETRNKYRTRRKKSKKSKCGADTHELKILSKAEWKALRNRYLNEQRKKMKEFKQYLRKCNYNKYQYIDKSESKGKYENQQQDDYKTGESQNTIVKISNRLTLSPGLIIKVTLNEPITKSSFKNEAKIFPKIKYFDFADDSNVIFVRFLSASDAEDCIKSGHWANAEIIKGEEEKSYWDKLIVEREAKLWEGRNKMCSNKRGREKLLKKAEEMHVKHIWFD